MCIAILAYMMDLCLSRLGQGWDSNLLRDNNVRFILNVRDQNKLLLWVGLIQSSIFTAQWKLSWTGFLRAPRRCSYRGFPSSFGLQGLSAAQEGVCRAQAPRGNTKTQADPSAEDGPTVTMVYVTGEAIDEGWVSREFIGHTCCIGAQRYGAEDSWKDNDKRLERPNPKTV